MAGTIGYGYPMGSERTERFKWPSISFAERQGYRYHRRQPPEDDDKRIQAVLRPLSTAEIHVIDEVHPLLRWSGVSSRPRPSR